MTERERLDAVVAQTRKELTELGVIKHKELHDDLRVKWKSEGLPIFSVCQNCGKELPKNLRRVCSGACFQEKPE